MAPRIRKLGKGATKAIHSQIDDLFARAKARLLGPNFAPKGIRISYQHELSIPGVFEAGAREEKAKPDQEVLESLLRVAGSYIDATAARTKARVINEINAYLNDAAAKGGATAEEVQTILGGQLIDVFREVQTNIHSIVDTEVAHAKNTSVLDGIIGANAQAGIGDPIVYFVVVRDAALCKECKRLHLLDDQTTPRLWKLSEVGHGYHKVGDENPKLGGLHPHCRCTLVTLMPGYGFDSAGKVEYKSPGFNCLEEQRKAEKSEQVYLEAVPLN